MRILNEKPQPFVVEFYDTTDEWVVPKVVREIPAETLVEAQAIAQREEESYTDLIQIYEFIGIHLVNLEGELYSWEYEDAVSHDID